MVTEYDFASFQQNKQRKVKGSTLFQYDNKADNIVGGLLDSEHAKEVGADGYTPDANPNGGHSIHDFVNTINDLPEGKYIFENGEFVKVN